MTVSLLAYGQITSNWNRNKTITSRTNQLFEGADIPLKQVFITHQKPQQSAQAQKVALIDIHI